MEEEGRREGMKYSANGLIEGRNNKEGNAPSVTYISKCGFTLYYYITL